MKKVIITILLCVMTLSLCTSAFAAEMDSAEAPISGSVSIANSRASSSPTELMENLPYTATLSELARNHSTYTRYYFRAPNETLTLNFNLNSAGSTAHTDRILTVYLYKVGDDNSPVATFIADFDTAYNDTHTFTRLNENSHYYFLFENSSNYSLLRTKTISGNIEISND